MNEHGTRRGYRHGCRCTPCKAANAAYIAAWRRQQLAGQAPLGRRVDAVETARKITALLVERFTKAEIARRLGRKRPKFALPGRVTLRTALKVRRLYRIVMAEGDDPAI